LAGSLAALAGCGGGGGGAAAPAATPAVSANIAVPGYAQFVYPVSGQLAVSAGKFQWTGVEGAASYQLQIGSSAGGSDVFDSGIVTDTSVAVPALPAGATLYARVRAIPTGWGTALSGNWPRGTYATFRTDEQVSGATFVSPAAGTTVDADTPIAWQPDPLARGYRLTIGSAAGGADLLDTGSITSSLRVARGLPPGMTVYATLTTSYANNVTRSQSLTFVVGNPSLSYVGMLAVARTLTGQVRAMADGDNQPYDATPLAAQTAKDNTAVADCAIFSSTLLQELADAGLPLQSRTLAVCFNTNSYDCHALVEVLDVDAGRWVTLDPTFGLYALNGQGQAATSADISAAARAQAFGELSYVYLTPAQASYAHTYYIDYPLLFLNVYQPGSSTQLVQAPPGSLEPYLDLMGTQVQGVVSNFYAIQCAAGAASATADWDGTTQTYPCTNGFTAIYWAISVATLAEQSSGVAVWRAHRFVF
jgi:hypothetical protein